MRNFATAERGLQPKPFSAVAKKLRADERGKNVKIIILTNVTGDMNRVSEAFDDNIFEYIVKSDIKIEDVVAKVKERLEKPLI